MQHLIERNKKKDAIYSLFHSHGSLKLMQECAWWTVCAKRVQPMWHLTCTQQQLAEILVIIQFWSNLLGLLIGFPWVPSIHASTNMIPTHFVSRCRWSLSISSICDDALAGCKLLSGCLKCCGTSSVKWRFFLIGAVLALSSTVRLLKCCS